MRAFIRHLDEKRLFSLEPSQRAKRIKDWYVRRAEEVVKLWPVGAVRVLRTRGRTYGVSGTVSASDVSALLKFRQLRHIWVDHVGSRKPRKKQERTNHLRWYAVRALFAIQVEGRSSGMQSYEDRIVVVMAQDSDDAVSRLRPQFRAYGAPYLNPDGYMVRWEFERIVDVYDMGEDEIAPTGTEIYSELKTRRMRPDREWHPGSRQKGA